MVWLLQHTKAHTHCYEKRHTREIVLAYTLLQGKLANCHCEDEALTTSQGLHTSNSSKQAFLLRTDHDTSLT